MRMLKIYFSWRKKNNYVKEKKKTKLLLTGETTILPISVKLYLRDPFQGKILLKLRRLGKKESIGLLIDSETSVKTVVVCASLAPDFTHSILRQTTALQSPRMGNVI